MQRERNWKLAALRKTSLVSGGSIAAIGLAMATTCAAAVMTTQPLEFHTSGPQITIRARGQSGTFTVGPAEKVPFDGERTTLTSDRPHGYARGTHLKGVIAGGTALPDCVDSASIEVKLPDGTRAEAGSDYLLDGRWAALGRVEGGRISTDTEVIISYEVGQLRLDSIVLRDGRLEYAQGRSRKNAPPLPEVPPNGTEIARIFIPYHATSVEPWHVYAVCPPYPEPDAAERAARREQVKKTLAKLQAGQPVTIVTWGDSVTVGGDASPGNGFAELFVTRLRERYPKSPITHVNAGIGATNTSHRLQNLEKDVLAHHPDLVTIEFVNDMGLPAELTRKNHEHAISAIRPAGGEVILITPHFTMPEMMGHAIPRGPETRKNVAQLRDIAREQSVGLADVSRRWEHLEAEGIPYVCYLENGINHPDDRGHELFVRELLTFFE
jgi:lysophospholipase L1-like esterase